MDYYIIIWSVCLFVETRVQSKLDLSELARQNGFSLAHMRKVFRTQTGKPLSHYILERKIANAAQELLNTDCDILEVALCFGFSGRDVFSRAFRRLTGYTPSEFRLLHPSIAQIRLCAGVYGPELPRKKEEELK